ncbi:hypothetical protein LEP1GSC008_2065 [Leptospira kirschneri serovar Bulgarica str. Nikolaevo]|uniref:Uncharacterized protein n=2 Tax=Leptospira kirschneri TaxID=29507 RepID=A0A0E2B8Z5_9LEPT|nr:hypothetical protein LEP1GSC081_0041 [Leptospira kirschneri str. H1]EMK25088.1 hypothetical protein LEP1GSC008_2065 [Leptospira kirschneri serovar Bulgarica str. Nikolaevo]
MGESVVAGLALSATVNQLHEKNVIRYFALSYNIERDSRN